MKIMEYFLIFRLNSMLYNIKKAGPKGPAENYMSSLFLLVRLFFLLVILAITV